MIKNKLNNYRLTHEDPKLYTKCPSDAGIHLCLFRPYMLEGVHCYLLPLSLLSWMIALSNHNAATFDYIYEKFM